MLTRSFVSLGSREVLSSQRLQGSVTSVTASATGASRTLGLAYTKTLQDGWLRAHETRFAIDFVSDLVRSCGCRVQDGT